MTTIQEKLDKLELELSHGNDISIINLVDYLIEKAHTSRVSDIHIDPSSKDITVRFRIDGVLSEAYTFPKNLHGEIISRIKVLSRLRTDEHQMTQDGRFRYQIATEVIDIRVSVMPTFYGEKLEMRLLESAQKPLSLEELGMLPEVSKKLIY